MTELKRCIACGESQQFLFRAIIEGREYFYHGSHDCHAPHVDMLATIAKAHAKAKCADYERLREALEKIRDMGSHISDFEKMARRLAEIALTPAAPSATTSSEIVAARKYTVTTLLARKEEESD